MAVAEITIDIDDKVAPLLNEMRQQHHDQSHGSVFPLLVSRSDMPDEVLRQFLEAGLFKDELGHRTGPRWLVERMAEQFKYPEAILTLFNAAYTNPEEPCEQFESLLDRFKGEFPWIMNSLAYLLPSCKEKKEVFMRRLRADQDELRHLCETTEAEARAKETTDPAEIEQLLALQEPRVLRALADNPSTPDNILKTLVEYHGGPLSRVIRSLAINNLQSRRHGTN
jgi:hypothetical protein